MGWKNQLTKTPYLVLFIVLISIGVGTASAFITITLAGNVVIDGTLGVGTTTPSEKLDVNGDAVIRGDLHFDDPLNNPVIFFDGQLNTLVYDKINDQFIFSDDLQLNSFLDVGGVSSSDDDFVYFDEGKSEWLMWDNSETKFDFSSDVNCPNCILGFYQVIGDIDIFANTAEVECDLGDKVTGGGGDSGGALKSSVSRTSGDPQGWLIVYTPDDNSRKAWAICADYAPEHIP